jgi:hypothetical protein
LPPHLFVEAGNLSICASPIRDGQVWHGIRLSPFIVDSRRRDPVSPAGDDALEDEQTPLTEFLRKRDHRLAKRHLRRGGQVPLAFLVAKRATPNRRVGSQGKARGEYASVLLGRYKYANQTIACQSKVFWRNNTANKTALARRSERDDMIHNFTGGSLGSGSPAKINSATAENRR